MTQTYHCLFCNEINIFSKHHKVNKYCNTKCQHDFQNLQRIEEWKRTGTIAGISLNTPSWLKRYILAKQDNKCALCGIMDWNGKPLVLDLEHKDGDSSNNKEENLCCLCPNCHSQTPTYKAKNKGNGRLKRRKQLQ